MTFSRRQFMATAAAAAAAPAIVSVPSGAKAAAPMVGKQAPAFYRFKVGEFEVTTLHDGLIKVANPNAIITNKTPDEIGAALDAAGVARDNMHNPFVPTVVNTGKNLVLIDTGFADNGPPTVGALAGNMVAAGIDPKTIDTILITHFHPDHISGLRNKAGEAIYPNAEIIVPAQEWKYWNDEAELGKVTDPFKPSFAATKRVFGPMAKDVKQADYGKEVVPGITMIDSRGHSHGHASYMVSSGNQNLLVLGDVTNNPAIFARNPEFRLWADQFPDVALASRRRLLDMASAEKTRVIGYHYSFPSNGYFVKAGNGYEFAPAQWATVL
jgi:glyoxylase-like metal-dependent hydrolase (beta-lactamase superfamily II)